MIRAVLSFHSFSIPDVLHTVHISTLYLTISEVFLIVIRTSHLKYTYLLLHCCAYTSYCLYSTQYLSTLRCQCLGSKFYSILLLISGHTKGTDMSSLAHLPFQDGHKYEGYIILRGGRHCFVFCWVLYSASADDSNSNPTAWYWRIGTPATINTQVALGYRITDLEVYSTSPYRLDALRVCSTGTYAQGWWWYYHLNIAALWSKLSQHNAHIVDIEV